MAGKIEERKKESTSGMQALEKIKVEKNTMKNTNKFDVCYAGDAEAKDGKRDRRMAGW